MQDPVNGIDERLQRIEASLAALTRRVGVLEDAPHEEHVPPAPMAVSIADAARTGGVVDARTFDYPSVLSLLGRTCVVDASHRQLQAEVHRHATPMPAAEDAVVAVDHRRRQDALDAHALEQRDKRLVVVRVLRDVRQQRVHREHRGIEQLDEGGRRGLVFLRSGLLRYALSVER